MRVLTIGHSTREPGAFLDLLGRHGATDLVDVRRHPGSRRAAWTLPDELAALLATRGLRYHHLPELGGRREPLPDSPNAAWRNESFRGFADHMQGEEFARGLARLLALARERTPAIMCAEAVPWRCHRNLVADALLARGVEVMHVMDDGLRPHAHPPFARVEGERVTYPPPGGRQARLPEA